MNISVLHACAFQDNYIWFIAGDGPGSESDGKKRCIIVDPGDADAAETGLQEHGLRPVAIFCTHRHGDHVGGVADLVQRYKIPVYGPASENIRTVDHPLNGGETVQIEGIGEFQVLFTPGHTSGHICYIGEGALFCGDTLFLSGCGRLFEGTAEQLYKSLRLLAELPGDTRIYCAHEYTLSNLAFAQTVEPENLDMKEAKDKYWQLRQQNLPTPPSTIERELAINPFLRATTAPVQSAVEKHVGHALHEPVEVFAELRRWKDGFTG